MDIKNCINVINYNWANVGVKHHWKINWIISINNFLFRTSLLSLNDKYLKNVYLFIICI